MKPHFESLNPDSSRLMQGSAAITLAAGLLVSGYTGTANAAESVPAATELSDINTLQASAMPEVMLTSAISLAQESTSYQTPEQHARLVEAANDAAVTLAHKIDRLSYAGSGALVISKTKDSATLHYGLSVENQIPDATSDVAVYDLSYTSKLGTRIPNPNKPTDISIIERGGTGVGKTYVYKMHKTDSGNWRFALTEMTSNAVDEVSFSRARLTTTSKGLLPTITQRQLTTFNNLAIEELAAAKAEDPITLARNVLD